jgi:hypothetical protein
MIFAFPQAPFSKEQDRYTPNKNIIMTRKTLVQAVGQIAHKLGYAFYCHPDQRMADTIIAYPAMWLSPPRVVAVQGRLEGRMRYRIALHLMELAYSGHSEEDESQERWCALEEAALEVCRALGENRNVTAATLTDCAPAEFSLTNHGERSMCLKMDVDMNFCKR